MVRPMQAEDIRYLYGAYALGELDEKSFPKGMTPQQFTNLFFDLADSFQSEHIVEANGRPVGIIVSKGEEGVFQPHAQWFSWATKRQILQGSAKYLDKMRQSMWGLIYVPPELERFMKHLTRYGIVRPVGRYLYHPAGPYHVYETVER